MTRRHSLQPVRVFGVDFTSAPSRRKPITCARCWLEDNKLSVEQVDTFQSFSGFQKLLDSEGPWIAGMDFPFGQPRLLIENLSWPLSWEGYVREAASMSKAAFVDLLVGYAAERPYGDRHHLRETDRCARAKSPMMVFGVPVGRMFYEGAKRLLDSDVNVVPSRRTTTSKYAVETYPALFARGLQLATAYKRHGRATSSDILVSNRTNIVQEMLGRFSQHVYGVTVELNESLAKALVADESGDHLDSVICGLQAAWAWQQPDDEFGIPSCCDPLEGWICDPTTLTAVGSGRNNRPEP